MTNEYGNELLHRVLLSAMKDIDKICRENDLKYFLHAGTLLGALNYKGFIPWDDDVDISMTQQDYSVLSHIIETEYSDIYRIDNYENTADHFTPIQKLRVLNTNLIYSDGSSSPIFIDFSIYHNVPDSQFKRTVQRKQLEFFHMINDTKSGSIIPSSFLTKFTLKPLSKMSKKRLWNMMYSVMSRYDKKETKYHGLMVYMLPNPYTGKNGYDNDTIPKSYCEKPQYVPFEDTEFMVYSTPEADVLHRYGPNWNKPYPEEKRISKHAVVSYELSDKVMARLGK